MTILSCLGWWIRIWTFFKFDLDLDWLHLAIKKARRVFFLNHWWLYWFNIQRIKWRKLNQELKGTKHNNLFYVTSLCVLSKHAKWMISAYLMQFLSKIKNKLFFAPYIAFMMIKNHITLCPCLRINHSEQETKIWDWVKKEEPSEKNLKNLLLEEEAPVALPGCGSQRRTGESDRPGPKIRPRIIQEL